MNLEEYMSQVKAKVEEDLFASINNMECSSGLLREAMLYAVEGGKRLRALTLYSVCTGLGGPEGAAVSFGAGIEMIHAYSLVHDDMPCMDNDEYRRGRLTVHKRYGEATALLVGDALLTMGFEKMTSAKAPAQLVLPALMEVSKGAGPSGMVAGQALDLEFEGKRVGADAVSRMYRLKTGKLFSASAAAGGHLAGCTPEEVELLRSFGLEFGYAFQIADDLDDINQGGQEEEKDTLAKELSVQEASEAALMSLEKALECLKPFGSKLWVIEGLSRSLWQKVARFRN